jgi:hypothetical protein
MVPNGESAMSPQPAYISSFPPRSRKAVRSGSVAFKVDATAATSDSKVATLCTEPVAVVVSEGERILYSVLSKPFASELGVESRWAARSHDLPAKSVTWRVNAEGKVLSEERGRVLASQWFPGAEGEFVEEVIGLGRYGKTLTVLSVKGVR